MLAPVVNQSSWHGRIELGFALRTGRTVPARRKFFGPLSIQKPFYPEGEPCHVYLLHPPGGVVGGDHLEVIAEVESGAHALITTPASGKFYRCDERLARQTQQLMIAKGGVLEWLPQDTILFDGCNVALSSRVDLEAGAKFIGWEMLCLGRPASGEGFDYGHCRQRFELYREGKPLLIERATLRGGSPLLSAKWGLAGYSVSGTLVATDVTPEIVDAIRDAVKPLQDEYLSATLLDEILVCRYLGREGEQVRERFKQIWQTIRPLLLNREASPPRIWKT